MFRIRFLPAVIFGGALLLSVKLGDILRGVSGPAFLAVAQTQAQQQAQAQQQQQAPARAQPKPAPQQAGEGEAKEKGIKKTLPEASAFGGTAADLAKELETGRARAGKGPTAKPAGEALPADPTLFTRAEIELLQGLAVRRDEIERRESEIVQREGLLQAAEKRLDKKIADLKELKTTIEGLLKKYGEQEEEKLKSLVKIYEAMKPRDAARIFEQLDLPIVLDVVERMREAKTAPIFAAMDPERAKTLTAAIAERRQLPKEAKEAGG
ncbi:MAG: hypothetical protein HY521_03655 [Proteobacteria bacterium]|nr:hypothetical protein [Pseudomonadota bacterium]